MSSNNTLKPIATQVGQPTPAQAQQPYDTFCALSGLVDEKVKKLDVKYRSGPKINDTKAWISIARFQQLILSPLTKISCKDILVLLVMMQYVNYNTDTCMANRQTLLDKLQMKPSNFYTCTKRLKALGIIWQDKYKYWHVNADYLAKGCLEDMKAKGIMSDL